MGKLTYNTRLVFKSDSDKDKIVGMLESQRFAWNECSKVKFNIPTNSIVLLHGQFYTKFRQSQPEIPSQVVISAEQSVLSAYRSIKSNKQKLDKPPEKKKLSIRLDKRTYSYKNGVFSIISLEKRVKYQNFSHHLANKIVSDTKADTIVLENLKSIKVKKHKYQNKNRISQVPMFELRRILTYKALLHNKQVITVSPAYTSQIDHRTGKLDGKRIGGRYIGKDGQIIIAKPTLQLNRLIGMYIRPPHYLTHKNRITKNY